MNEIPPTLRTKTIDNYSKNRYQKLLKTSNDLQMLNWWTIERTLGINGQKLLKCDKYSLMLNYMHRKDSVNGSVKAVCHNQKQPITSFKIFCALSHTFTVRTYQRIIIFCAVTQRFVAR